MDNWERFCETLLPNKKDFYSNLIMEDITEADYKHPKRVWEDFEIKNWGQYNDLYVQSDILVLACI